MRLPRRLRVTSPACHFSESFRDTPDQWPPQLRRRHRHHVIGERLAPEADSAALLRPVRQRARAAPPLYGNHRDPRRWRINTGTAAAVAPWGTWRRWCWITAPTTPRSATATRTSGERPGGDGTGGHPLIAPLAPGRTSRPTGPAAAPRRRLGAQEAAPPLPRPLTGERALSAPALGVARPRPGSAPAAMSGPAPAARAGLPGGTVTAEFPARGRARLSLGACVSPCLSVEEPPAPLVLCWRRRLQSLCRMEGFGFPKRCLVCTGGVRDFPRNSLRSMD